MVGNRGVYRSGVYSGIIGGVGDVPKWHHSDQGAVVTHF